MKFLCGSCRTKYQISDEKVRGKILTIRCKKCGAKILVRESLARDAGGGTAVAPVAAEDQERVSAQEQTTRAARVGGSVALASDFDEPAGVGHDDVDDMPTSIAPVPANLEIAGVEWYVAIDGQQHGPFAFAEVVRKIASGDVVGRNYVWHDGMQDWTRVREVKDLAQYLSPSGIKKAPPPPPAAESQAAQSPHHPSTGNVVDIAQKRAEIERKRGLVSPEPQLEEEPDSELDLTTVEPHNVHPSPEDSTAFRAEQLDNVLNEALGISPPVEDEDDTQAVQQQKKAVVLEAVAVGEDDLSFDGSNEDIFANVPRAFAEEEEVRRESTRFFVAAAGVNRQKSRNRLAFLIGLAVILSISGFMTAWAYGIIEVRLPGIGNPFKDDDQVAGEDTGEELLDDGADPDEIRKQLAGRRKKPVRRVRRTGRKSTGGGASNPDYIDDDRGASGGAGDRRGDTEDPTSVGIDLKTGGAGKTGGVGDVALPSVDPTLPPVETGTLDEATIQGVVRARQKSVRICYQQSLKGQDDLRGKLEVLVIVSPNGHVSRAEVETLSFKGSRLGHCIEDKIKSWVFPRFNGEPKPIRVPFVFEQQRF